MTRYIHGFTVRGVQAAPEKVEKKAEPVKPAEIWHDPEKATPMSDGYVLGATVTKAGKTGYAVVRFEGGEWKGTAATVYAWADLPDLPEKK